MTGVTCASLKRKSGPGMWTALLWVSANSGSTPVDGRMKCRSRVECDHSWRVQPIGKKYTEKSTAFQNDPKQRSLRNSCPTIHGAECSIVFHSAIYQKSLLEQKVQVKVFHTKPSQHPSKPFKTCSSCPFKDTCSFTSPAPNRFQENPSGVGQIMLCVVRNSARVDTKLVSHPMSRLTKKSPPAIQTSTISGNDSLYSVPFQTVKLSHTVLVLETDVLVELLVEVWDEELELVELLELVVDVLVLELLEVLEVLELLELDVVELLVVELVVLVVLMVLVLLEVLELVLVLLELVLLVVVLVELDVVTVELVVVVLLVPLSSETSVALSCASDVSDSSSTEVVVVETCCSPPLSFTAWSWGVRFSKDTFMSSSLSFSDSLYPPSCSWSASVVEPQQTSSDKVFTPVTQKIYQDYQDIIVYNITI